MKRAGLSGFDLVAVVLAVGLVAAVAFITIGVLYDAIASEGPGLSDNATQVLTASFGGIIGVLGSYIGFRVSAQQSDQTAANLGGRASGPSTAAPAGTSSPPEPADDA